MVRGAFAFLLILICAFSFAAAEPTVQDPTSCAISPSSLSLQVASTSTLSVNCYSGSNEVACPAMGWASTIGNFNTAITPSSITFNSGTVAGSGTITASPTSSTTTQFSCSIPVSVMPGQIARLELVPDSTSVLQGSTAQFYANLYDAYNNQVPSADIRIVWLSSSKYGKVDQLGRYLGQSIGTDSVTATYGASATTPALSDTSTVTVIAQPFPSLSCSLSPSYATLAEGGSQRFVVSCYSDDSEVNCPPVGWQATSGAITPDPNANNAAIFTAGSSAATITAYEDSPRLPAAEEMRCSATVSLLASNPPSGGSGGSGGSGSNNGGGAFASSTVLGFSCAGQEASLFVKILRPGASAAVQVIYLDSTPHAEVFSENISSSQNLTFLPSQSGAYELRVSVGSDQRTVGFRLQECTLITNVTKNVEIELQQPPAPSAATAPPPPPQAISPSNSPPPAVPPAQIPSEIPSWAIIAAGLLILAAAALLFFGKKKAQQ